MQEDHGHLLKTKSGRSTQKFNIQHGRYCLCSLSWLLLTMLKWQYASPQHLYILNEWKCSFGRSWVGWIISMCLCSSVSFSIALLLCAGTCSVPLRFTLLIFLGFPSGFLPKIYSKGKMVLLCAYYRGIFLNLRARSMALPKAKWQGKHQYASHDLCSISFYIYSEASPLSYFYFKLFTILFLFPSW